LALVRRLVSSARLTPRPYSQAVNRAYGWKLCNPAGSPQLPYSQAVNRACFLNLKGNENGYYSIY